MLDEHPSHFALGASAIVARVLGLATTVLRAYRGREAIEVARRTLPDLIAFRSWWRSVV